MDVHTYKYFCITAQAQAQNIINILSSNNISRMKNENFMFHSTVHYLLCI